MFMKQILSVKVQILIFKFQLNGIPKQTKLSFNWLKVLFSFQFAAFPTKKYIFLTIQAIEVKISKLFFDISDFNNFPGLDSCK